MKTKTLGIIALFSGILVVALLAGIFFFSTAVRASAQTSSNVLSGLSSRMFHHGRGGQGMGGFLFESDGEMDSYLADALGISVEELQDARVQAKEAAIQQAVDEGLLTEEQADALRESDSLGTFGMRWFGLRMHGIGTPDPSAYETYLAEALGISVEKLEAARQAAHEAAIQAAIESGDLTQDQADLLLARQALRAVLDRQALTVEALGISVDQLQAYHDDGLRMSAILEEVGMTAAEFQEARQAAYEAAVSQAVSDGVITQDQADALQSGGAFGNGGFGGCEGMGGGRGGRGGGMRGFPGGGGQRWSDPGDTSSGDV